MAETKTIIVKTIGQLSVCVPYYERGVGLDDLADLYERTERVLKELSGVPSPELEEEQNLREELRKELLAWGVRGVRAHIGSIGHLGECLVENRLNRPHSHAYGSHELIIAGPPEKTKELEQLLRLEIPREYLARRFLDLPPGATRGNGSWMNQQRLEIPGEVDLSKVDSVGHLLQISRESNGVISREREF